MSFTVIGAGFDRTGTDSMRAALAVLGFGAVTASCGFVKVDQSVSVCLRPRSTTPDS